jgi:hypothetical protein
MRFMRMNRLARKIRRLVPNVRRHGLGKVLFSTLLKTLDRRMRFKVLRCHHVAHVAPAFLDLPPTYAATFLTRGAVRQFMRDPELEFAERFVQEAFAKGDKCYGVTQNGGLSAYSWCSTTPTRFLPGLKLYFNRDYVYMYRAYTRMS